MERGRCCGRSPGQNVAWASSNVGDRRFVVVGGRRPSKAVVYFCFVVVDGRRCRRRSVVVVVCVVAGWYESHVNAPLSWNRW